LNGLDECKGEDAQRNIIEMISKVVQLKRDFPLVWLICSQPEATSSTTSLHCHHHCRHPPLGLKSTAGLKSAVFCTPPSAMICLNLPHTSWSTHVLGFIHAALSLTLHITLLNLNPRSCFIQTHSSLIQPRRWGAYQTHL